MTPNSEASAERAEAPAASFGSSLPPPPPASSLFEWEGFEPLPPDHRQAVQEELQDFLVCLSPQKPVAVVSSGGTLAYLEQSPAVRQLDNFSTGTRGATAVEILLKHGYAVIHLWRQDSVAPFVGTLVRQWQESGSGGNKKKKKSPLQFLKDVLEIRGNATTRKTIGTTTPRLDPHDDDDDDDDDEDSWWSRRRRAHAGDGDSEKVCLRRCWEESSEVYQVLQDYREGRASLHTISFTTVDDYLQLLPLVLEIVEKSVASSLSVPPLVILAAAVSDYFVPLEERSRDKISQEGRLTLTLSPVPKVLSWIKKKWCPSAMLVTFKLETDPSLLRVKALNNLHKYQCDMVIGNLLATRYETVTLYTANGGSGGQQNGGEEEEEEEEVVVVTKNPSSSVASSSSSSKVIGVSWQDALEEALWKQVMERHYALVASRGCLATTNNWMERSRERKERRAALHRRQQWRLWEAWLQRGILQLSGSLLGMALSFGLTQLYQKWLAMPPLFLPKSSSLSSS